MRGRDCTCGGVAPGFPQHEAWCGLPEDEVHEFDENDRAHYDTEPTR